MKSKAPLVRSLIIITIIVLSVLLGLLISTVIERIDRRVYPREFSELVEKYSAEFAVPEYIIYGVIKQESDFASGNVAEDGGIGLMGISESEFDSMLKETKENLSRDALYGPETNIKYGAYKLASLYNSLEDWRLVCGAYYADAEQIGGWLEKSELLDENGHLTEIPDKTAAEAGEELYKCAEKYRDMYYGT